MVNFDLSNDYGLLRMWETRSKSNHERDFLRCFSKNNWLNDNWRLFCVQLNLSVWQRYGDNLDRLGRCRNKSPEIRQASKGASNPIYFLCRCNSWKFLCVFSEISVLVNSWGNLVQFLRSLEIYAPIVLFFHSAFSLNVSLVWMFNQF